MTEEGSSTKWPPHGGEMGALLRAHDWSATALGDSADWPDALRFAVSAALDAPRAMIVLWGPGFHQFYNDGFRPLLGERHPAALGERNQDCWPEFWQFNAPILTRVMANGETVHLAHQEFVIAPTGAPETRYFTFTYQPLRDRAGGVCGVLVSAIDTTGQLLAERSDALTLRAALFSAEQFEQMFAQVPNFMALLRGPEHVFELANPAFQRLFSGRELLGIGVRKAIPEMADQAFLDLLDQTYVSGLPFMAEAMPVVLPDCDDFDSNQHFLNFVYQPIRDAQGQVCAIMVQGSDVSLQHHVQLELEQLNDRLTSKIRMLNASEKRKAFQLALGDRLRQSSQPAEIVAASCEALGQHLGIARVLFCEVDETNRTFFVRSDWAKSGLGSVAGAIRVMDDFGPDIIEWLRGGQTFAADDVATDPRTAAAAAVYAQVGIGATLAIPLVAGGKLSVILNLHNAGPYHWSEDDIELARDMAERTWAAVENARAQAELKAERDQSRYIFDSMTEGFAMLDRAWRFTRVNAQGARIVRRVETDLIGRHHWEVLVDASDDGLEQLFRRVRSTGMADLIEYRHGFADGTNAWLELRASVALNGGLALFFRDITTRRLADDKLREADRLKDEFLAMLAHELRNPLAPIAVAADLLHMPHVQPERVRQISEIITRQVRHMTGLVNDLLDVSRVTRGLVALQLVATDIKSIVADAVEQIRPLIEARSHRFSVALSPESIWVSADKERLVQVVANLLNNSAKYTPLGGAISLAISTEQDDVVLTVRDDGVGMDPFLVARVFELFAQAERTPDRTQGGLGIGLALVKTLVELHGGSVTAKSGGKDAGSEFTVRLPRLAEAPARHSSVDVAGAGQLVSGLRVLLVEDNMDAAEVLALFLEQCGHVVTVEYLSRSALDWAQSEPPEVCILDIGLPDMDGRELALRLRTLPQMDAAVLIALTGYGQEQDRDEALAAGFDHFLVKPVETERLAALLADIVYRKQRRLGRQAG
jgi:PAS domain S-box-containing protein